ncbi:dihydrolipoamide acetyltransferase family protein [Streptomyces silvisoli]|uniref:Dihydrolipoamide acetyltransferase component of pyruvate dehydrogenase complex n=1 Tax=Streptomyces silvisoli TaxID=3034235 RepID=A0ABT5ZS06_9ACTN|nr:dihydrolipoamide acetyltransferase family protein [Streptomyces silvisoli]MDF3292607.1 dihydrolipoamide acetyltransferase family protein [Streptomyces silvisoli]
MPDFTMPSLGADMEEGTLLEWLVRPGDTVRKGDVVAVVETTKSTIEVECFGSGTVERLLVEPGTTVPVGTPLATIATGAEARPPGPVRKPAKAPKAQAPVQAADQVHSPLVRHLAAAQGVDLTAVHGTGPGGSITRADVDHAAQARSRIRATPLARRLADVLGVDPRRVMGSGAGGTVRADDVRKAARAKTTQPTTSTAEPGPVSPAAQVSTGAERAAAMRRAIGDLMSRSKREIPHYYLSTTIDLMAADAWMRDHNRRADVAGRLIPTALLLKATALAAREVPQLNGFWQDGHFVLASAVHLGVAVALRGGGLVAPALHDADTMALADLMARLKDLTSRARSGRLRSSETSDPTLTVTSLGDQGVEAVFGVIYPPQVALVGFGRVVTRPCAVNGLIGARPTVTATLSADHRASDGAIGARFLAAVDRLLQQPETL